MSTPVAIVLGDADTVAPPTTNGLVVAKAIHGRSWSSFPASDTMISCLPAAKRDRRSFRNARSGFPQADTQSQAIAAAQKFFSRNLKNQA